MFKLYLAPFLSILLAVTFTGCVTKEPKLSDTSSTCMVEDVKAPDWVCGNSTMESMITAVGSSSFNNREEFTRQEAVANAHINLSEKIQLHLKDKVSVVIAKQIAHKALPNAKQIRYWRSSREIYVLIALTQNSMSRTVKDLNVTSSL